jgi:hypothetical protein
MSNHGDDNQGPDDEARGAAQRPSTAMVTKTDGMGAIELARKNELAASASQSRELARVQAKYVMAMQRPRDNAIFEQRLFARCVQKDFAEVAIYRRPQGKKKDETGKWVKNIIEGLSIRFVEEAIRCAGNMSIETVMLYDDNEKMIVRCTVTDYESVFEATEEVTIFKTVERANPGSSPPIDTRRNSYGDMVYIVPASDDDVRLKKNRLVSMTIRTLGLRALSGGTVAEAKRRIYDTLKNQDKGKDPVAVRREIADKFANLGISAQALAEYFGGVSAADLTNDQVLEARVIGATVTAGEATWHELLEGSPWREAPDDSPSGPKNGAATLVANKVKESLDKRKAQPTKGAAAAPAAAPAPAAAQPAHAAPSPKEASQAHNELTKLVVRLSKENEQASDADIADHAVKAGHAGVTAAAVAEILSLAGQR